ncbi:peroxidase family protein [Nisaea sp.]|uniref:peroxidase family protein n=1 Tax=Nisaea sp. TaxID=2024842 RepID=UPI003B51940E
MDSHEGLQQLLSQDARGALTLHEVIPGNGFRHFIRQPGPSETFKVFGQDPRANLGNTSKLFEKLSHLLDFVDSERTFWGRSEQGKPAAWENTSIPAGYTYLLQFITHDLVHTSLHTPDPAFDRSELRNHRATALNLDTLYGASPTTCPYAYAPSNQVTGIRTHLRLSPFRNISDRETRPEHRLRDIGRGVPEADPLAKGKESIPLIVDPRNDDNSNISQILTVFILLHNKIFDHVHSQQSPNTKKDQTQIERDFLLSKEIITLLYKKIIEFDVLPKILHQDVHDIYKPIRQSIFDQDKDKKIPLEFSHAVLRFGHAMVRESYTTNDRPNTDHRIEKIVRFNSQNRPNEMPLDSDWIIQWSKFFEFNDFPPPNYSRKIGPSFAQGFRFTARTGSQPASKRDLLRGAFADLWSVKALAAEISKHPSSSKLKSKLLFDPTFRKNALASWLTKANEAASSNLTSCEIEHLSLDPPLFFYTLFEAMEEGKGKSLGTLGSIIFSETIYKYLPGEEREYEKHKTYIPALGKINTASDLIHTVACLNGMEDSYPHFI